MTDELTRAFSKAKIGIMSQHNSVFISTILFSLKHSWSDEVPTAGTDGIRLLINAPWFMGLTPKARIGLLAHEAWHPAFDHINRRLDADLDAERWNIAGDHVINNMLKSAGYELPPGGLCDPQYKDMSTKAIYDLLPETPEGGGGYDCDIMPGEGEGDEAKAANAQAVQDIVVKAAMQAKMSGEGIGNMPGEIQMAMQELLNPKLPWQTILQNFYSGFAKDDYSFKKRNRRFSNVILPGLYSEALDEIACAVDSSGSVRDSDFAAFITEMHTMKETLNPKKFTVIDFDTQINNAYELSEGQSVRDITFSGRGGTRLQPVFDYYKDKKPTVLIVFSDLGCHAIQDDPGYPVIWIIINNPRAKTHFGREIHYDL